MAGDGMELSRRVSLLAGIIAAALLAGCGAGPPGPAANQASAGAVGQRTSASQGTSASPDPSNPSNPSTPSPGRTGPQAALPVAPGAGALPQTRAFPRTDTAAFRNAMADLWLAVTTGNPRLGRPAFFPEAAYRQVKAIPYPTADWNGRLWYDFTLDVGAAHRLLGPGARLVRVIVPVSDAAWVYPGACYNSAGYWHVPGARVVYLQHGEQRSFGIASLISWRGVWYVVHFGAVLRGAVTGIVDQPAVGPGIPGPPGGC